MQRTQPARILRNFVVISLLIMTCATVSLTWFMHWISMEYLYQTGEAGNVAKTKWLAQELWKKHGDTLKSVLQKSDSPKLQSNTITSINSYLFGKLVDSKTLKVKIMAMDGTVIFSTDATEIGTNKAESKKFQRASKAETVSVFSFKDRVYAQSEMVFNRNVVSSYIPVFEGNSKNVIAVAEVYTDVTELVESADQVQLYFLIAVIIAAMIVFIVLVMFVYKSSQTIHSQQEQILKQATHDELTGLPNRTQFYQQLTSIVDKASREKAHIALLLVDIDHFKDINDKFGHSYGDELLKVVTLRIRKSIPESYLLARLGDDEFAILCDHNTGRSEVMQLATSILDKVQQPVTIDAEYVTPTICIGISVLNDDSESVTELLQHADAALYQAKSMGGSQSKAYAGSFGMRNLQVYELEYELTRAMEESEFLLYYQPKVDVTTGQIVGAEALMRWNSYTRGFVSPADFIPVLESSGMIHQVGAWVLHQACLTIVEWKSNDIPVVPVSVNVSAEQFKDPDFVSTIEKSLQETGVEPSLLELELTESCLMEDAEVTLALLNRVKELGVSISIDDFGTGYSSLSYLKRFPIDVLKIDRSFIHEVYKRTSNDNAAIVTAIMSLSHSLRMDVIAEGVETAKELAFLNALGCRIVQGFLFSEPLPQEAFEDMLIDNAKVLSTLDSIRQQLA